MDIQQAISSNNLDGVKNFIEKGGDIESIIGEEQTLLSFADSEGKRDIAQYLVQQGAKLDVFYSDEYNPLQDAAIEGNLENIKMFYDLYINEPTIKSPLNLALNGGHIDIVEYLISKSDIDKKALTYCYYNIVSAAGKCDGRGLKFILDNGGDPHGVDYYDEFPLMSAASIGCIQNTELLLKAGADIEQKDTRGRTSLYHAVYNKETDMVKFLIDKKADVNSKTVEGKTPIQLSEQYGLSDVSQVLKKAGAV